MKKRAFSLIELIIVLAIISISFFILVFRFSIIDRIGAENEIKAFVNDYSYARDTAISTGFDSSIIFTDQGYEIKREENIKRELKYIDSLNVSEMVFYNSGYVLINKTKSDHKVVFTSKKDPQKKRTFTIEAVGGYIYENK